MSKKETVKKEKTPKKEKVPATKKIDKAIAEVKKSKTELIEFSITAIIPTQMYGNIQPTVKVKANTLEDARDAVVPFMEDLYKKYTEVLPKFLREVVVVERVVPEEVIKETPKDTVPATPENVAIEQNKVSPPTNTYQGQKTDTVAGQPKDSTEVPFGPEVKNEAYVNAENAIASAQTMEALDLLQKKVNDSVKIEKSDKPFLDTLILKKKKEIK